MTDTHTWADSFGIWHARVTVTDTDTRSLTRGALRARARRAIMAELLERSPRGTTSHDLSFALTLVSVDTGSATLALTYTETDTHEQRRYTR